MGQFAFKFRDADEGAAEDKPAIWNGSIYAFAEETKVEEVEAASKRRP